ncbi:MAG: hypothetical protein GY765_05200 [bacterium]|nr:hypothetical protein [bacterium]
MKKLLLISVAVLLTGLLLWDLSKYWHKIEVIDAFSGATPIALQRDVPDGLELRIEGKVKKHYTLGSAGFRLLAPTRVRTREVSPDGELLGSYIYNGVPLLYILEGVAPLKTKEDAFNRPLDMMVVFHSASGKKVVFSYGELTMTADDHPPFLAFFREPLQPTKSPETYKGNKNMENITGLRLVCPGEPDTARYLDNVQRLTLVLPPSSNDHLLPEMRKGEKCISDSIQCLQGETVTVAMYENVERVKEENWFRIGHGRGVKGSGLASVEGVSLISFLRENFPGSTADDFFMFVACDGYRCLFSGREIFRTSEGRRMLLIEAINGVAPAGGKTLGALGDFFVDRNIWGLSHVKHIKDSDIRESIKSTH